MAKFKSYFGDGADLMAVFEKGDAFSVDDLLEVLRPAAIRLVEIYRQAITTRFQQRSGDLADSIDFEDNYLSGHYASMLVKPFGTHSKSKYTRRSRAGPQARKYAKHGRTSSTKPLKNEELAYLLEYGTSRIDATHWMETANEESESEIQGIIDEGFTALLAKKGLL